MDVTKEVVYPIYYIVYLYMAPAIDCNGEHVEAYSTKIKVKHVEDYEIFTDIV